MTTWLGYWQGGRIRQGKHGPTFLIDRMRNGKRYNIALEVGTERQALAELALFERNPEVYRTASEVDESVVRLTDDAIESFVNHLKGHRLDEHGKPVLKNGLPVRSTETAPRSSVYIKGASTYLQKWRTTLYKDRDVRTVKPEEMKRMLAKLGTARKSRITVLKSFMSFLRNTRGVLTLKEDPTVDLLTPTARSKKASRLALGETKFYELSHIETVYRNILWWESKTRPVHRQTLQAIRDLIRLCSCFGMHVSEVGRVAKGECIIREVKGHSSIAGTISFIHKTQTVHVVSVDILGLAAARRLQERGSIPFNSYVAKIIRKAAEAGKCSPINPGTLRHSFITNAKTLGQVERFVENRGAPLDVIAATVGHMSTNTTRTFYLDGLEVPPMIVLPLKLVNTEDPSSEN